MISAARDYYAFDLAPAFWQNLAAYGATGRLCTIDRIANEILAPAPLKQWIDNEFCKYVHSAVTPLSVEHYRALMQWAGGESFTPAARDEFARVADAWLVAYAKAMDGAVVTHEAADANCRRRVKIPNACQFLGVRFLDTFQMLRELKSTIKT